MLCILTIHPHTLPYIIGFVENNEIKNFKQKTQWFTLLIYECVKKCVENLHTYNTAQKIMTIKVKKCW